MVVRMVPAAMLVEDGVTAEDLAITPGELDCEGIDAELLGPPLGQQDATEEKRVGCVPHKVF